MFSVCEFGGHKQGPEDASIDYRNMPIFVEGPMAHVSGNYMTAWNFAADASELAVQRLTVKDHDLSSLIVEPHLVVMTFQVGIDAGLIHGNLHIRTPTNKTVSIATRRRMLAEALRIMHETEAPTERDGALQPVAYVLVGDPNLGKADAEQAIQAFQPCEGQWDTVWQVLETDEKRGGDIVLVKGARALALDLPVGPDKANKGVRNDNHDAIGVELSFAPEGGETFVARRKRAMQQEAQRSTPTAKRQVMGSASRSVRALADQIQTGRGKVCLPSQAPALRDRVPQAVAQIEAAPTRASQPGGASTVSSRPASLPASSGGASQPASPPASQPASSGGGSQRTSSGDASQAAAAASLSPRQEAAAARRSPRQEALIQELHQDMRDFWENRSGGASQPASPPASAGGGSQRTSSGDASQAAAAASLSPWQEAAAARRSPRQEALIQQLDQDMRDFWENRKQGDVGEQLGDILFAKQRYPCPLDVWIVGDSQPGEKEQYVEAVVSKEHVMRQIQKVIELREEWLSQQNLPMDCQMRDHFERKDFLEWAKTLYHQEPFQKDKQANDLAEGGNALRRSRMHSRWGRELQRRLGSASMWQIVSFSGKFDPRFLKKAKQEAAGVGAAQPDARETQRDLKRAAHWAREQLRLGEQLKRKAARGRTLQPFQQVIVAALDSGKLLREANAATELYGCGRIKKEDGSWRDIGPNTGGLTRTVLDNMVLFEESSGDEANEGDANEGDEANEGDPDAPVWT
jgi:hypothetical protein